MKCPGFECPDCRSMNLTNLPDGYLCDDCGERGTQSEFLPPGWCVCGRQEPCPHTDTDDEFLQISVSNGEVFVSDQSGNPIVGATVNIRNGGTYLTRDDGTVTPELTGDFPSLVNVIVQKDGFASMSGAISF